MGGPREPSVDCGVRKTATAWYAPAGRETWIWASAVGGKGGGGTTPVESGQ